MCPPDLSCDTIASPLAFHRKICLILFLSPLLTLSTPIRFCGSVNCSFCTLLSLSVVCLRWLLEIIVISIPGLGVWWCNSALTHKLFKTIIFPPGWVPNHNHKVFIVVTGSCCIGKKWVLVKFSSSVVCHARSSPLLLSNMSLDSTSNYADVCNLLIR